MAVKAADKIYYPNKKIPIDCYQILLALIVNNVDNSFLKSYQLAAFLIEEQISQLEQ